MRVHVGFSTEAPLAEGTHVIELLEMARFDVVLSGLAASVLAVAVETRVEALAIVEDAFSNEDF